MGLYLTSALAGFRNRIINGATRIDSRNDGAAQTITAGAALAYTIDNFYAYCTGANVSGQRVVGSLGSQFRYQFTGAASVTKIGFAQRIEQRYSYDLNNSTATLSVDLANSLLTTVTWTAWYANTADTFGTLASPTRTQIATGSWTVSSTIGRYSTTIAIPSAATTGIEIEFSVGAQTSGTWTIGNIQLEPGSVATAFEFRPVSAEQDLCARYLPAFRSEGNPTVIDFGFWASATTMVMITKFRVPTRSAVTGITLSAVGDFRISTNGSNYAVTSNTFSSQSTRDAARWTLVASTGAATANNIGEAAFTSASGYFYFTGAEL